MTAWPRAAENYLLSGPRLPIRLAFYIDTLTCYSNISGQYESEELRRAPAFSLLLYDSDDEIHQLLIEVCQVFIENPVPAVFKFHKL